jgi:acetyl esterase/lipase
VRAVKESYTYKTVDGCAIKADVYRVHSAKAAPVVVWIHGGALIGGGRGSVNYAMKHLLQRSGYAVVSIDYRLAPETKLPQIIEDVRDAFDWVREVGAKRFGFDSSRIGVLGGSAGGYLTLMSGLAVEPRPQALVSFYGYGDIVGPWYSEPDPFYRRQTAVTEEEARASVGSTPLSEDSTGKDRFRFYLWCRQNGYWPREIMGVDDKSHPAAFVPYCPERNVTKDYPPTLLLHGTADTDVPYRLSVDMAGALDRAGVPHDLVTIEDGSHGFDGRVRFADLELHPDMPEVQALACARRFIQRFV